MNDREKFADYITKQIKSELALAGISLAELERQLDVGRNSIQQALKKGTIKAETLNKIALHLNIKITLGE